MSQLFVSEFVNIDQFPQMPLEITIKLSQLKFIFMLVRHGVVTNLSQENYARLVAIFDIRPVLQNEDSQLRVVLAADD